MFTRVYLPRCCVSVGLDCAGEEIRCDGPAVAEWIFEGKSTFTCEDHDEIIKIQAARAGDQLIESCQSFLKIEGWNGSRAHPF